MMSKTTTEPMCSAAAVVPADIVPAQDRDDLLDIEAVCRFFGGTKPLHPATKPLRGKEAGEAARRRDDASHRRKLIDAG